MRAYLLGFVLFNSINRVGLTPEPEARPQLEKLGASSLDKQSLVLLPAEGAGREVDTFDCKASAAGEKHSVAAV